MLLIKRFIMTTGLLTSLLIGTGFFNPVMAAESKAADAQIAAFIQKALTNNLNSNIKIEYVNTTPLPDMYEVLLDSGEFIYINATGDYFFTGTLFNLQKDKPLVNITQQAKNNLRAQLIQDEITEQAWVFSPEGEVKASISVFTDVDCFYCQKLHTEIEDINKLGIEVRYLGFPRAGLNSPSYQVLANAWCSDDANGYLTLAKKMAGDKKRPPFAPEICENPVAAHYNLGKKMGINATPSIILADGSLMPGYLAADALAERLGIN